MQKQTWSRLLSAMKDWSAGRITSVLLAFNEKSGQSKINTSSILDSNTLAIS